MKIKLPASVQMIIESLQAKGYEAYAVGGCVRDSILGREPDDWDVTTSAQPMEVKEIFRRTVDTGLQHGTVTVLIGDHAHEVTTYRIDGDYEDGRHPKEVIFTASLEEDLKRRDFTINAMAYNDKTGLVDLYGGVDDLQRKCIRCVGRAEERFGEDALRILRALRFAAQLGFGIEKETYEAICQLAPTLEKISAERIATELTKLMVSDRPEYIESLYETGITKIILPEFDAMMETEQNNPHHCYSVGRHTIESLKHLPADKVLRFTMLLHDIGKPQTRTTEILTCFQGQADKENIALTQSQSDEKSTALAQGETDEKRTALAPGQAEVKTLDHFHGHSEVGLEMARKILRRLKFDNDTIYQVTNLIKWHDCRIPAEMKSVRKLLNKTGPELFEKLLLIQYADTMAQSNYCREEKLQRIKAVESCYQQVMEENQCVSLKDLAITGQDLIALGMRPGPQIGEMLQKALDYVLEDPSRNEKENLISYIKTSK